MDADGSIVISAEINTAKAERDLAKLKSEIIKTERDISDNSEKREVALAKSSYLQARLEKENQLLRDIFRIAAVARGAFYTAKHNFLFSQRKNSAQIKGNALNFCLPYSFCDIKLFSVHSHFLSTSNLIHLKTLNSFTDYIL